MQKSSVAGLAKSSKKYLFWCVNEHIDFRIPELKSIATLFNIPLRWVEKPKEDPFMILEMDSEKDAQRLVSRCMLVRACYELWGDGQSEVELHNNIKQQPASLLRPHLADDKSFSVRVDGFNKTLKSSDKLKKIEALKFMSFDGPVNLRNPDTKLHLIEYYGLNNVGAPQQPYRLFLGRYVGNGGRDLIARYSLKQRSYIGSTSMDAQLAFIMSNLAQLQPGCLVLDPFVGTGSVLVSAAHHGAFIWGSDIDFLTLHARTKPTRVKQTERGVNESIASNLSQYDLSHQYLDVAVVDCAKTAWRVTPLLDAIVTDPPYGIRESTARVGKEVGPEGVQTVQQKKLKRRQRQQHQRSEPGHTTDATAAAVSLCETGDTVASSDLGIASGIRGSATCITDDDRQSRPVDPSRGDNRRNGGSPVHYPSKVTYSLCDVFKDLLNFAANNLVVGGRLVFWMPVNRDDYNSSLVPSHPCLSLSYNCEQVLNAHASRRLITLAKTRPPRVGETATAEVQDVTSQFREKFFIAAQMSREERMARKVNFTRDKRGQSLSHRTPLSNGEVPCMNGYSSHELDISPVMTSSSTNDSATEHSNDPTHRTATVNELVNRLPADDSTSSNGSNSPVACDSPVKDERTN